MRIKGLTRMFRGLPASTRTTPDASIRQSAAPFPQSDRFSAYFAQWVCSLTSTPPHVAASPPPNGGNGVIRTTTRRRHADSQLLMLQNPHRSQPRAPRCIQDRHRVNFFALAPTSGRAGRQISRTGRRNIATMKQTTPLLTPNTGPLKPTTPLRPKNAPKNAHFSPAKATTVSNPHRHKQAKAIAVSNHRATSPATPRRSARGRLLAATPMGGDDTAASQISHVIYRGHYSIHPKNVAMPTMQIQCLNER